MSAMCTLLLLLCGCAGPVLANIDDALWSYETLHPTQFRHKIVKRDVSFNYPHVRQMEFKSLGRHFNLHLQKKSTLFSLDFNVVSVNAENEQQEVSMENAYPYEGHVIGEEGSSRVHAVWEDEENLSAFIVVGNDAIFIEPSWRHLPKSDNYSMIIYRKSDVKTEDKNGKTGDSFCGYINATREYGLPARADTKVQQHDRTRRAEGFTYVPVHTTCQLLLVADYLFYKNIGGSSLSRTTSYLIGLIDRIDAIYRRTDYGNGYVGVGFEIKEIRVHEEFSKRDDRDPPHYNVREHGAWQTKTLLESFSHDSSFAGFCLAHLFTYQAFDGGVLGLAYIGSPRTYSLGGICSPSYYKQGARLYLNTGWSSGLNHHHRRLFTQEADLVTTHEFGHNWGSEHDPDETECAPSAFKGGKYIMYMYSVSGYDANNKVFSPCSRRSIGAVLEKKANNCFSKKRESFCGNMLVEAPVEECDVGPEGQKGTDPCCDENCRLKANAECSDVNDLCCTRCTYAPRRKLCHEDVGDTSTCEGEAHCTGSSPDCPAPDMKPDGSPCLQRGNCKDGKCVPFCEGRGLVSCICDTVTDSCMWCCKKSSNSTCIPYKDAASDNTTSLPNGMPCIWGSCDKGVCKKETQELVQRFWSIIENITPDRIAGFLRENLVGMTIILSLIVWIPISCIIGWQDKKALKQDKEKPDVNDFYRGDQASRVRRGQKTYRRETAT